MASKLAIKAMGWRPITTPTGSRPLQGAFRKLLAGHPELV